MGHLAVAPGQFDEFGAIIKWTLPDTESLGNLQQEFYSQRDIYFVAGPGCATRNSAFGSNRKTDDWGGGGSCWLHDTVNMVKIVAVRCDILHTDSKRMSGTTGTHFEQLYQVITELENVAFFDCRRNSDAAIIQEPVTLGRINRDHSIHFFGDCILAHSVRIDRRGHERYGIMGAGRRVRTDMRGD